MKTKPHYFELVMRSVSDDTLNQEVIILREYAHTPGELCLKQMQFTKDVTAPITEAVIKSMDAMSLPIQELGMAEMVTSMEEFGGASKPAPKPKR